MKHEEDRLQANCVKTFRMEFKDIIIAAIPNGGYRSEFEGKILKATGVLAGMPDLLICSPRKGYGGLFIELKSPTGSLSKTQKVVMPQLEASGYKVAICRTIDEFMAVCREYLSERHPYVGGR